MEIRFQSNLSELSSCTLRRDLEETDLTQVLTLRKGKGPTVLQDTINGYRDIAISPPFEEPFPSISKFPSPTVATSAPTLPVEPAYVFPSIYDKRLEFLNRGGIITGLLPAVLIMATMTGYIPLATGISATAALLSIFSAFVVERLRLFHK